jgi:hypothetical protein
VLLKDWLLREAQIVIEAILIITEADFSLGQQLETLLYLVEHMRILPDGNVGIGTASPTDKLHAINVGDIKYITLQIIQQDLN